MSGSTKFAVPTCTADAPAMMNSSASAAVAMPPMPMIGMRIFCRHSYTMRTAIGRIAGPLSPPTMFESFGRRVSTSMAIARNVLTSDTASAPASSAALAIALMSVTFGVSFGMTGSRVAARTARDDIGGAVQAAAERDAAFLDVRARDVQLERGDAFDIGQDPRQLDVLLQRRAADVDDDHRAAGAQLGHLFRDEAMHADALKADGVQHAGRRLDDARRRMPFALGEEQPFTATPPSDDRSTRSAYSVP